MPFDNLLLRCAGPVIQTPAIRNILTNPFIIQEGQVALERGERGCRSGIGFDSRKYEDVRYVDVQPGTFAIRHCLLRHRRRKAVLRRKDAVPPHGTDQAQHLVLLPELHAADGRIVLPNALDQSVGYYRYRPVGCGVDVGDQSISVGCPRRWMYVFSIVRFLFLLPVSFLRLVCSPVFSLLSEQSRVTVTIFVVFHSSRFRTPKDCDDRDDGYFGLCSLLAP